MLDPLYVRPLIETEQAALEILLASAKGIKASKSAASMVCSVQTVRNTIHAFEQQRQECHCDCSYLRRETQEFRWAMLMGFSMTAQGAFHRFATIDAMPMRQQEMRSHRSPQG